MTHSRNVDGLRKNAQKKRLEAIERTKQGIDQLLEQGKNVSFKAVAEVAEVSTAWLYKEPDIKNRIEFLREQNTENKSFIPKHKASDESKGSIIKTLNERIKRLEAENKGLRSHLEVISSQVLQIPSLEKRVASLQAENVNLRDQLNTRSKNSSSS
jgi:predicted nuclease with TOPRIM domain